jgi:hypothetical protein
VSLATPIRCTIHCTIHCTINLIAIFAYCHGATIITGDRKVP